MPGGFTPPEQMRTGAPADHRSVGNYGGPSAESVQQQINHIQAFLAERK